jgi:hypothetical protein
MARRRMIDPNFFISEDVSRLDIFERFVLIGLFSNADDYGKGRAKPEFLRSIIFPYDDIPLEKIKNALTNISKNISIKFYNVNNSSYYIFLNWDKWQRVDKPQPSLIPDPIFSENYAENDSKNESENDSKNDSKNDSENDSCLKEKKRKENKRKEFKEKGKELKPALSKNFSLTKSRDDPFLSNENINADLLTQPIAELTTDEILIRSYGRSPTEAEREFLRRLIQKFGEKKTLSIMKTAKLMNFKNFINLENSLDANGNFKEKNSNGIYAKYITQDKLRAISESIANDPDLVR